jgi:hypothetical protein
MSDSRQEIQELDEFHAAVAVKDAAGQGSLLRNGPLPDTAEGLVEAGIRCIPLINSEQPEAVEGAVDRLQAIQFKLKLLPETVGSRKVMEQFDALLESHRREDASNMKIGFALILGLLALVAALVVFIVYRVWG